MSKTHNPTGTLAIPVEHTYPISGKTFWIVECQTCMAVLNSAHHYITFDMAANLAADHNKVTHGIGR